MESPNNELIQRVVVLAKKYMSQYDASHDWNHILRVLATARQILREEKASNPDNDYDETVVTLSA